MNQCYKCHLSVKEGDVWYGLHQQCFLSSFALSSLDRFQDIASQHLYQSDPPCAELDSTFFHGKFRKYSSTLGGKKYLLKVREAEFPELPSVEYVCNQIFQSLGINVPPYCLIIFEEGHTSFVTENFMAHYSQASLLHLYHFFKKDLAYNCENILQIISEKTGRLKAQEQFVYLTLADSLIGNNDRHGRNLAFIHSSRGYELSPFYDNTSYLGIELDSLLEADHQPKGTIKTAQSDEPTMKDYVLEWQRLGFDYVVKQFRDAVSLSKIKSIIDASDISQKRKQALFTLISKRSIEL